MSDDFNHNEIALPDNEWNRMQMATSRIIRERSNSFVDRGREEFRCSEEEEVMEDNSWHVIDEAPNYEVNEDGEVRNIRLGRIVRVKVGERGRPYLTLNYQGREITVFPGQLVSRYFG